MMPKLYADTSLRRALQVGADLAVVVWVWAWVVVAGKVHDSTMGLATPGRKIDASAGNLADRLRDAGKSVANVPLVGDSVRTPFDGAGKAASGLSEAGRQQVSAVTSLADWLGLAVALIPVLMLLWFYLPSRLAFIRRATAGRRFVNSGADLDLFALRAMASQPLHVLAKIDPDPAGAWRRGESAVIDQLARLELRSVGLRVPHRTPDNGRSTR